MDGICHGICPGSPTSHPPLLPLPLLDDAERFGRVAPAAFGTAAGRASGPRTKVPFGTFLVWICGKHDIFRLDIWD